MLVCKGLAHREEPTLLSLLSLSPPCKKNNDTAFYDLAELVLLNVSILLQSK